MTLGMKLVFFHPGAPRSTPAAPRSFTVLPGGPTVSTRFNTVHPGRAPLPGPPRFTTVVFDMSKTTGKTPGSSRSIRHHPGPSRWHYGSTPGTPRFTPVHGPGSTGSPVGLMHKISQSWNEFSCSPLYFSSMSISFLRYGFHACIQYSK